MRLPVIQGVIRRRLLVNFRVDSEVMERFLPAPFRPKLHAGFAIAGICLIRLEEIRPKWLPRAFGVSSENAAHRVAVRWDDEFGPTREGVFIPRRDTDSWVNHLGGGRIFPGEHHLAKFDVTDDGHQITMAVRPRGEGRTLRLRAHGTTAWPADSCFASLADSSSFFEGGSVGYSVTKECCRLDGIRLATVDWEVLPLAIDHVESSFFTDESKFPKGSVTFDHALIMRDVRHEWHYEPDLLLGSPGQEAQSESATPSGAPAIAKQ